MLAKELAFVRRDLGIAMTYRVSFLQSVVMLFFGLLSMDLVSSFINEGAPPALASYGNDYFGYALIGLSVALFAQEVAGLFPGAVRSAQVSGTLEVIVGSRTSLPAFLAGSSLYGIVFGLVRLALVLALADLVFGAHLFLDELLVGALVLALTMAAFAGLGIFAAGFVVWFKQHEPFTGAFITVSLLFSGVLYPTAVLPNWLEWLASLLPLTHTVEALRATLLQGAGVSAVVDELAVLSAFALLLPAGVAAFAFAVRRAKAAGSLGHY